MVCRKDLVDISDDDYKKRRGEFMQCLDCGERIDGTQGDFFQLPMDYVFRCPVCESKNVAIVWEVTKIVIVKQ